MHTLVTLTTFQTGLTFYLTTAGLLLLIAAIHRLGKRGPSGGYLRGGLLVGTLTGLVYLAATYL
jgi:hypothetical protein